MSLQPLYFILSDDELHAPHQLGPNLRDRNPQVRPYALERVEGYNEAIACGAASTRCSPNQSKPARSQSKPSQAKVLTGAETCAKRKSTSLCLLAIPAFDRKAGLKNRHLISNRGICLR